MKTLYIIRGLPGSGKSTYAKELGVPYFEADQFFYDKDGNYNFDTKKLNSAHNWCWNQIANTKGQGIYTSESFAISNTSTKLKEFKHYIELGRAYGFRITIIELKTSYGSIHNVPEATIEKMKARWQEVPKELYDSKITIEEI
jgi:predicted kinase